MEDNVLIKINNLKAYYVTQSFGSVKSIRAVDGINMDIRENEILGIAGESGSGKSTLGRAIYGYYEPPFYLIDGNISYKLNDEEINIGIETFNHESIKELRWEKISYIPQSSMNVLNPVRKIYHILNDLIKSHNKNKDTYEAKFMELISNFGLPANVVNLYPYQLSGGMRQRVVIAFATLFNPKVVIADEPTSALDVVSQWNLLILFKNFHLETKSTFVFITHDMSIMANLTDRVAIMYAGKILEIGKTKDIFNNPLHPYTKFLINSIPEIGDKSEKLSIPGFAPNLIEPPLGCRFYPRCPIAENSCENSEPQLIEIEKDHKVACFLFDK